MKNNPASRALRLAATCAALCLASSVGAAPPADATAPKAMPGPMQHVLLISVDGLHAFDLQRFVRNHPQSALAQLAAHGIDYTDARTPAPADSFPGLMALLTGGTPAQTGIYYDVTYNRRLAAPGSDCRSTGAVVRFDEDLDLPGAPVGAPALDTAKLPRDPARACAPVWPHEYLRVNTVFDVVRTAGGYTAWADKHPVYEIVMGPAGHGVDDLYTPEIGNNFRGPADTTADKTTASVERTAAYDRFKAQAVLHQIAGRDHAGQRAAPVPTLFGLNLQAVSVGQKRGGYLDRAGRPSPALALALRDSDALIADLVDALRAQHLLDSTLVIVTAKHGNSPVDPARLRHVARADLQKVVRQAAGGQLARITSDDVALVWLKAADPALTRRIAGALQRDAARLGIDKVLWGERLAQQMPGADHDPRSPDLVVLPREGVIYTEPGDDKRAEHGGFNADDRHVALLLSNPVLFAQPRRSGQRVDTTQVAPTLLDALGLDPNALQAVRARHVRTLPQLGWR
ncbi:MAG: alkaline phosphatase family protein [Burkholderiales bacterium]|nr:alkaline phosphatase family protein [Burkholderiales bacterium]